MDHDTHAQAERAPPKKSPTRGLILTVPFLGVQFPVGYWPDEEYPYYWPGEIHRARDVEERWSSWYDVANYAKLGNIWLSVPKP